LRIRNCVCAVGAKLKSFLAPSAYGVERSRNHAGQQAHLLAVSLLSQAFFLPQPRISTTTSTSPLHRRFSGGHNLLLLVLASNPAPCQLRSPFRCEPPMVRAARLLLQRAPAPHHPTHLRLEHHSNHKQHKHRALPLRMLNMVIIGDRVY
jgi:hypothetical protein